MRFNISSKSNLMAVEFRAVNTNKTCFASYSDTAGTTHTGSIHHNGVQRNVGGNFIFFSQQANEFHHDGRTDGETFVYRFTFDYFLHAFSH